MDVASFRLEKVVSVFAGPPRLCELQGSSARQIDGSPMILGKVSPKKIEAGIILVGFYWLFAFPTFFFSVSIVGL